MSNIKFTFEPTKGLVEDELDKNSSSSVVFKVPIVYSASNASSWANVPTDLVEAVDYLAAGSGSAPTPGAGGSPGEIQYNNAGSIDGVDKLTFDGSNLVGTGSFLGTFSGSLTKLTDGSSYLSAGAGITVTSASNGQVTIASTAGASAPADAQYLTLATDATLTNERTLFPTNGIIGVDGGAGNPYGISIDDSVVATVSGSTFTGAVSFNSGLSGSLTKLTDGTSYLVAGNSVTITSASNGQVTVSSQLATGNTLYVDSVNGDDTTATSGRADLPYLTVSAAITGSTSGDVIILRAGTYAEGGLTLPQGVTLRGQGDWQSTFLGANSISNDIVTLSDECVIDNVTVYIPTGSDYSAVKYSGNGVTNTCGAYNLRFLGDGANGQGIGVRKSGPGKIIGQNIRWDKAGFKWGMYTDSGAIALDALHFPPGAGTIEACARVSGSNGRLQLGGFNSGNSNISEIFQVAEGTLLVYTVNIFNAKDIVCITNSDVDVGIFGGKMAGTGQDVKVDPSVTATGSLFQITAAHSAKYFFPYQALGNDFELAFFREKSDTNEASYNIFGPDFSVGFPSKGSKTALGEGRSFVSGNIVFSTDSTASPTSNGGGFSDISDAAASLLGSTFTFQGTTAGHSILWASNRLDEDGAYLRHWGIQLDQAIAESGGEYVFEIQDATDSWVEVDIQAIEVDNRYVYNDAVFLRSGTLEDIRLGVTEDTTWATTTINSKTGKWARVRITSAPSTLPEFQRLTLHPSYTLFNKRGFNKNFGLAMWRQSISAGGNIWTGDGTLGNFAVPVGSGGAPTGWTHAGDDSLLNTTGDGIYFQVPIPEGICSAYGIKPAVHYWLTPGTNITGAPELTFALKVAQPSGILIADPAGGTVPVPRTIALTPSLTGSAATAVSSSLVSGTEAAEKLHYVEFDEISIENAYPGDIMLVHITFTDDGTPNQDLGLFSINLQGVQFAHGTRL